MGKNSSADQLAAGYAQAADDQREAEEAAFIREKIKEYADRLTAAREDIATEIFGQDEVIAHMLGCMIADGHMLAEGLPGLGKTSLVSRLSRVMGLESKRIPFTPDLTPTDITGGEVWDESKREFTMVRGPVFTQFLLADEINRGSPRTQSALLEAMQERQVTVNGQSLILPQPFFVFATQNPIESDGTNILPEAQRDRFMVKINFDYPDRESERRIMTFESTAAVRDVRALFESSAQGKAALDDVQNGKKSTLRAHFEAQDLIRMQALAARLPLSQGFQNAVMDVVRGARPDSESASKLISEKVQWGPSPRAAQAFAAICRARALMRGDHAPDIDDIKAVAPLILPHRMQLKHAEYRRERETFRTILDELTRKL